MKILFFVSQDFNLGVAYVITYLKSIGHEVRLFIEQYPNRAYSISDSVSFPGAEFKPDLICFSCVTANYGWASQMANHIRTICPTPILFGGVHPTLCPEDFKGFDVCQGDGIAYFGGKFDPDNLWPDREIFFEQLPPVHREYQIFMTGFGCPMRCSFCNNHQLHTKITRRTPEGCIKELIHLKKRGLRYVLFDDDIFTLNHSWLRVFVHDYVRSVGLPFTCFGHTRYLDDEIVGLLKKAKCECIWLGVQSGDEETRRTILNRPETNIEIKEASALIKKHNIKLMIDHIFGLPQDTYGKLLNSYNLYKEIKPDVINCYELLYLPKADINKFGTPKERAYYQKQGGHDYQRYAKSFASLPLRSYQGVGVS